MLELFGGLITGSVAIASDAIHDFGDAISIGLSYFFERKSNKSPDHNYTYGYSRYSVLGSIVTITVLIVGSIIIICNAVMRLISPVEIRYNQMIIFAIIGLSVNLIAAFVTRRGNSLNQKAVNLHMLEDVLGWTVVLVGAIVIKLTGFVWIDPILSIIVSSYILINAVKHFIKTARVFTDRSPVDVAIVKQALKEIPGIMGVHHIHIWTTDGENSYATLHVVSMSNQKEIKQAVRDKMNEFKIGHVTIELESKWECCNHRQCKPSTKAIKCACCDH